jgi:hypothetical protein
MFLKRPRTNVTLPGGKGGKLSLSEKDELALSKDELLKAASLITCSDCKTALLDALGELADVTIPHNTSRLVITPHAPLSLSSKKMTFKVTQLPQSKAPSSPKPTKASPLAKKVVEEAPIEQGWLDLILYVSCDVVWC